MHRSFKPFPCSRNLHLFPSSPCSRAPVPPPWPFRRIRSSGCTFTACPSTSGASSPSSLRPLLLALFSALLFPLPHPLCHLPCLLHPPLTFLSLFSFWMCFSLIFSFSLLPVIPSHSSPTPSQAQPQQPQLVYSAPRVPRGASGGVSPRAGVPITIGYAVPPEPQPASLGYQPVFMQQQPQQQVRPSPALLSLVSARSLNLPILFFRSCLLSFMPLTSLSSPLSSLVIIAPFVMPLQAYPQPAQVYQPAPVYQQAAQGYQQPVQGYQPVPQSVPFATADAGVPGMKWALVPDTDGALSDPWDSPTGAPVCLLSHTLPARAPPCPLLLLHSLRSLDHIRNMYCTLFWRSTSNEFLRVVQLRFNVGDTLFVNACLAPLI